MLNLLPTGGHHQEHTEQATDASREAGTSGQCGMSNNAVHRFYFLQITFSSYRQRTHFFTTLRNGAGRSSMLIYGSYHFGIQHYGIFLSQVFNPQLFQMVLIIGSHLTAHISIRIGTFFLQLAYNTGHR